MKTITATELKKHSGEHLDDAVHAPVLIQKTNRPFAVLVSFGEYERLRACEDAYWIERAQAAQQEGHMGAKATAEYIQKRLAPSKAARPVRKAR